MKRLPMVFGTALLGVVALAAWLVSMAIVIAQSDWFRNQVRERIITEVERATGGTAEIGAFTFEWRELRARIDDFVLRGSEPPDHAPLFRARSIVVGLKVISAFEQDIDIALLEIDAPRLSIETDADGNTNFPERATGGQTRAGSVARLVDLAVKEFRITNGEWSYQSRPTPFALDGRNLEARAAFDPALPGYQVRLGMDRIQVDAGRPAPLAFDARIELSARPKLVTIESARFASGSSSVEVTGTMEDTAQPATRLRAIANLKLAELAQPLKLPVEPEGTVEIEAELTLPPDAEFTAAGSAVASGLAVESGRVRIGGIQGSANWTAGPGTIRFREVEGAAIGGKFSGEAVLDQWRELHAEGGLRGLDIRRVLRAAGVEEFAWAGVLSGPVKLDARFPHGAAPTLSLTATQAIAPAEGGLALEGEVSLRYESGAGVELEPSHVLFGSSRLDVGGSLDRDLRVGVFSENLDDFLPVFRLAGHEPPGAMPVRLEKGVAQFGGLVSNLTSSPQVAGHAELGPLVYRDVLLDNVAADFDAAADHIRLRQISARQGRARLAGDVETALADWKADGANPITGSFRLTNGDIASLLAAVQRDLPLTGALTAAASLAGTVGQPVIEARISSTQLAYSGEAFDSFGADVRYADGALRIETATLKAGDGTLDLKGGYRHDGGDWRNGEMDFELTAGGFRLGQWRAVRDFRQNLDAAVRAKLRGVVQLQAATPRLAALTGDVAITGIELEGRPLGDANLSATTTRNILSIRGATQLKSARITTFAEWNLTGESFGLGQFEFHDLTLDELQELGLFGGPETEIYFDGSMDGEIGFVGQILRPASWRGMAKISRIELTPVAALEKETDRDLTVRNQEPLLFGIDPAQISIQSARLVSSDIDLEMSGTLSYLKKRPWNLRLAGTADLAVLTAFREDLLAEGKSTVDATIRGSLLQPQLNGALEFNDASFFLRDLPNGITEVNGRILFDRTRANIQGVTSRTGGGTLELGGFISFGGEEWIYRLQGKARDVRVRYPEGVSTLFNADLDLTGSASRSILTGDITVARASFNPETDLGSILSESRQTRPATEIDNPFLRGMQFDVAVNTAANAEILTSLTKDIELQAGLRLRGTPIRPVVLGRVSINRGEIRFFGNRYTINQGEVTFFNPVKIEPVLAMDLETTVRGYTVMMNFTGPLDKLNFSYRSDPPLQSEEIIALLTVGRTPGYGLSSTRSNPTGGQAFLQGGGNSLLGQALAAPVSSRLQRFFGVSRIKIDPQLTGVDNTPETHVTIEQQLSRDLTLTYVTNLSRTQQQIVRIEWNFSEQWSVYAVRDSNGVFGMDFVYRKRF